MPTTDEYLILERALTRQRNALSVYKRTHDLSDEDFDKIQDTLAKLGDAIGRLNAQGAISALDEAGKALTQLEASTEEIEQTLKNIENIGKVVAIAGAILTIAGGVMKGSGEDIGAGIEDLVEVLKPKEE